MSRADDTNPKNLIPELKRLAIIHKWTEKSLPNFRGLISHQTQHEITCLLKGIKMGGRENHAITSQR